MIKEQIYKKAIDKFGKEAQLMVAMEECAELIQAISKLIREEEKGNGFGKVAQNLAEEIADVEIMIEQIPIITDLISRKMIDTVKKRKLERLEKLVDEENFV